MSTLKVNSIIPVAGVPTGGGGGIIQIKQTVKTDTFSQTTVSCNTFSNDCGLNVSITPTSTSSKIYIMGTANMSGSDATSGHAIGLFKDGSVISSATGDQSGSNRTRVMHQTWNESSYTGLITAMPFQFLDSPATTSSITYGIRLMILASASTSHIYLNQSKSISDDEAYKGMTISVITAMEVSA